MSDREPVAQRINSMIATLEDIARMVKDKSTYDEVEAEDVALWTVRNHVSWILMHIMDEQKKRARIRAVK